MERKSKFGEIKQTRKDKMLYDHKNKWTIRRSYKKNTSYKGENHVGGSVITERLYIDLKQDFKKKSKKKKHTQLQPTAILR